MGKPFRINEPGPRSANIGRAPDGKFQRLEAENPGKIAEEAKEQGVTVSEVVRARRVPDHPVSEKPIVAKENGDAVSKQEIPWPVVAPVRPPMRLR